MKILHRTLSMLLCAALVFLLSAPLISYAAGVFPACDCGSTDELVNHTDSCALKSYIRNTYNKTYSAEEIYADWNSIDSTIQTAILTLLSWDDYAKYTELKALVDSGSSGDNGDGYPTTGSDKINININIPEGAFPAGTVQTIEPIDAKEYSGSIEADLAELDTSTHILALYATNITFTHDGAEVQPSKFVGLTFTIPAAQVPAEASTAYVYHIADDGSFEVVQIFYNLTGGEAQTISVSVDSFSSYVIAFTGQKYQATLLRDALANDDRYSISTFPVTLYNYDATALNNYFASKAGNKNYFYFWGGGSNAFMPNDGAAAATMGILKNKLVNGLPSMQYGYDNGADIFGTGTVPGKTVYEGVQFEFIYDKQTGYYEYNSGLNHAQYNSGTNRIELYTDTMGAYNYFTGINQTTPEPSVKMEQTQTASSNSDHIKFKAKEANAWLFVDHVNRDLSVFEYVYIRMNSKLAENGGMRMLLWFTDGTTAWVTLDLKTGWNEYYFDLNAYSGQTLRYFDLYPGSSASNEIEISRLGFLQKARNGVDTFYSDMGHAGFFPFANISQSYPNVYETFNLNAWKNKLALAREDDYEVTYSTRSHYNGALRNYDDCPTDPLFHLGVSMDFDVYLPIDFDKNANANDLIFSFNGDDDLWVFIDGELVLDVGGAHTPINGVINFTDGTVYVENQRTITSSNLNSGNEAIDTEPYNGPLDAKFKTYGYHNIKIYYLERASTGSNCRFYFNTPAVPTGNVEVSKTVEDQSGLVDLSIPEFTYTITTGSNNALFANKNFQVVTLDANGAPVTSEERTTTAQGTFTLKHGQKAVFSGISEGTAVKVTEDTDNRFTASYTVNGKTATSPGGTTSNNGRISIAYLNKVRLTSIKISKEALSALYDVDSAENQSFLFHVKGSDAMTKNVDVTVAINISPSDMNGNNGSDYIWVTNIPIGSYTVTEDQNWGWRYSISDTAATTVTKTVTADSASENNHFAFSNTRNQIYWLSGDNYTANWWGGPAGKVVQRDEETE